MLPRITEFVGNEFPVVCDPDQISRKPYEIFNAFIIDRDGVIQTRIPGTKAARPSLDLILQALAEVEGVPTPERKPKELTVPEDERRDRGETTIKNEDVIDVLWMWSHDRIGPGDAFKLAFLPTLAEGFHVYAPSEKQMSPLSVEFDLPKGIELLEPVQYPKPLVKTDPVLQADTAQYEKDIPLPALNLRAADSLEPGRITVSATLKYQACNDVICFPPATKRVTMDLEVVPAETKRNQVAGWQSW